MNLDQLRDYNEWLKYSPGEIIEDVKTAGGWSKVFPDGLTLWAHRVRNYFNHEPLFLKRLSDSQSEGFLKKLSKNSKKVEKDKKAVIASALALSGDVYLDNNDKIWYQMSPGATIYHFKKKVSNATSEAIAQTLIGQAATPLFKLISPDDTGGSHETIIDNPQTEIGRMVPITQVVGVSFYTKAGKTEIGEVNKPENISHRVSTDYLFQGSYNYAETLKEGLGSHEKYDVKTHEINTDYENPKENQRFSPLWARSFPKTDSSGKLLADQKW